MSMTRHERKDKIGWGAVSEIAKNTGLAPSTVSETLNGKKLNRKAAVAIARKCRVPLAECFPEFFPSQTVAGA